MKIEFDCVPCIYRQVLEASRMVINEEQDRELIRDIINEFARMVPEIKNEENAPQVVAKIQNYIKQRTGINDPYYKFKKKNMESAFKYYPDVVQSVKKSRDSLLASLVMSAMGNSIDAGISLDIDIKGNIKEAVEKGFKYSDYQIFKTKLRNADRLLLIADNVGEAVFDKLLIQELLQYKLKIIYAVRETPILNDITIKEAKKIGLNNYCTVISSGCDTPGTILSSSNTKFINEYSKADIIISKGQGNLEGLLDDSRPIFFLLKIKCDLISRRLNNGLQTGDFVFIYR